MGEHHGCQHQDKGANRDGNQSPPPNRRRLSPRRAVRRSQLIKLCFEQSAPARGRRQQRIEVAPVKVNEFADGSFKLLRAHPALPAGGQVFPEPLRAARRPLTIRRENGILVSRMSLSKPHTSPLSRTRYTCEGPLQ